MTGYKTIFDCPMARYTTFRVGGTAEAVYHADDLEELSQIIRYLNREGIPCFVMGRGSNLLIRDSGISGLIIQLKGALATIEREHPEDPTLLLGAGLSLADLLSYCRRAGLSGLEFLAGIPCTVGGAAAMNAGAFGEEFCPRILEIQWLTAQGDLRVTERAQLRFSYRTLEMEKDSVIVRVRVQLRHDSEKTVAHRITQCLRERRLRQPLEYPSAGSVFKNPPGDFAGRLIEAAGLKGKKIGGAMISEKHANFIINTGGAKAEDILGLMDLAESRVKEDTGIELEPEVRILGNGFTDSR